MMTLDNGVRASLSIDVKTVGLVACAKGRQNKVTTAFLEFSRPYQLYLVGRTVWLVARGLYE